jgi:predicted nucleic acid-binding protein
MTPPSRIPLYHAGYVVDASVAVRWFMDGESEAGKAQALLEPLRTGRIRLAVPGLLFFLEVAAALKTHPRAGEETVSKALKTLWALGLESREADETLLHKANAIAHGYHVTLPEGAYVALAEMLGFPLLTADADLIRRMKAHAIVLPLASMELGA